MDAAPQVLLAAALASLLLGCSPESQQQSSGTNAPILIEPNVAVGPVHAGMTTQQVITALGPPQRTTANALEYTKLGFAVVANTNGLVQSVMCGDVTGIGGRLVKVFAGRTREGIGMNSTRDEVLRALGEPSSTQRFAGGLESISYAALGLTLTLEGGKVHHLIVRFPAPDSSVNLAPAPAP